MAILFLATISVSVAFAGEHPSDHPAGEQSAVTTDNIAAAIYAHVKKESKRSGYFTVEDKGKKLSLTLEKIHKERLSAVKKNLYFACVDFTEKGGKRYDIDFFLKDGGGSLKVTETMVHKEDGTPRYNWMQKGDFWVKKSAN